MALSVLGETPLPGQGVFRVINEYVHLLEIPAELPDNTIDFDYI